MRKSKTNTPLLIGFSTSILSGLIINLIDFSIKFDGLCSDCDNDFGQPFKWYQSGSFIHSEMILWRYFLLDVLIFSVLGVILGVLFNYLWNSHSSRGLK